MAQIPQFRLPKTIAFKAAFLIAVTIACSSIDSAKRWQGPPPGKSDKVLKGSKTEGAQRPVSSIGEIGLNLERHIDFLAKEIGERNLSRAPLKLERAAAYISAEFEKLGYTVDSQYFEVDGVTVRNVEATKPGTTKPEEIVVVGAHYDTVEYSPGANDNGSGVAAILEIGRLLANSRTKRTLRLVAFTNEEPPYFRTENMGSVRYAKRCRASDDNIIAMLSLDSLGYYSSRLGSQEFPEVMSEQYPKVGNFIAFVSRPSSSSLTETCFEVFKNNSDFPAEIAVMEGHVKGIGWSDHWSFWQENYSALMVTDTAVFRHPQYHTPNDTPYHIDFKSAARVVDGLFEVVSALIE